MRRREKLSERAEICLPKSLADWLATTARASGFNSPGHMLRAMLATVRAEDREVS